MKRDTAVNSLQACNTVNEVINKLNNDNNMLCN